MTTLAQVLQTYAPEISETDFAADLRSKFEEVHGADDISLTSGELEFLNRHGGETARAVLDDWDPDGERRRRNRIIEQSVQHIYVRTLSAAQVAGLTRKSRSQITRDLNTGKLYGLNVGRHWRIPRWQFADDRVIPGLAEVVPAIPEHLHPTVVEGFMTTPQDELDARTPVDYLRTGGDPALVAEMVVELAPVVLMPKVPAQPPAVLSKDPGDVLAIRDALWRIHPVKGPYPMPWNGYRTFGPLRTARFDPHPEPPGDHAGFGVAYTAVDVVTCVAEVFQQTRTIALTDEQDLTGWLPVRDLLLLDLTGTWALRNGAANSLASARRQICPAWSAEIRTTWPDLDGLLSRSTMTGRMMVTLFEPAADSFPPAPSFRRPLDHPVLQAIMERAAGECGYRIA